MFVLRGCNPNSEGSKIWILTTHFWEHMVHPILVGGGILTYQVSHLSGLVLCDLRRRLCPLYVEYVVVTGVEQEDYAQCAKSIGHCPAVGPNTAT